MNRLTKTVLYQFTVQAINSNNNSFCIKLCILNCEIVSDRLKLLVSLSLSLIVDRFNQVICIKLCVYQTEQTILDFRSNKWTHTHTKPFQVYTCLNFDISTSLPFMFHDWNSAGDRLKQFINLIF